MQKNYKKENKDYNDDKIILRRIKKFQGEAMKIMNNEKPSWKRADNLYKRCFDDIVSPNDKYNPLMMLDIVSRVVDDLKLADYVLRIPGSDFLQRQLIRDAIAQQEQQSGLTACIRDDDKGALSWAYYGNCFLWFGAPNKDQIKEGTAIEFKNIRLEQVYFSESAVRIRDHQGNPEANECLVLFDDSDDEVREMFPKFEDKIKKGLLPFANDGYIEDERYSDAVHDDITQRGYYYNVTKGQFYIVVGADAQIVEKYDDNDPNLPNYPFKMDGKNYLPLVHLKAFPVLDKIYAKGLYHRFAKIAENDASRRNLAHQYAEKNIHPDKFVSMNQENFSTFQNNLELSRDIIKQGGDAYVPINPGDNVQVGDFRTAPLSQEFERMREDDKLQVTQGGIAIQDVDYGSSQKATTTIATERNKTRLVRHMIKINSSEAVFIRKIIIDFFKRYITKNNEVPLSTNAKITNVQSESTPQTQVIEAEVKNITLGMVSEYLKKQKIYIQENYSAFDDVGYKLQKIQDALPFAAGTPQQLELQREAMAALGYDVKMQQLQQAQGQVPETNMPASASPEAKTAQQMISRSAQLTPQNV